MLKLFNRSCGLQHVIKNVITCPCNNVFRMRSYRAAVLTEYNKPLTISSVKDDVLKSGMVRIAVSYCSLNTTDVNVLKGLYYKKIELPIIPGHEFSGSVLECGPNLKNEFQIGDRVVALRAHDECGGGLGESVTVHENDVFLCNNLSSKDAAILPYGHGTALLAFTKYCVLNESDLVIVTAGPGGLGLGAIEVAASVFKAKVIAICDTEDTSSLLRDEGAFQAITVGEGLPKVYKYLEKALNGKKAKIGIDAVGDGLLHLLDKFVDKKNGTLISIDPFYDPALLKSQKIDFNIKPPRKSEKNEDKNIVEKRSPLEKRVKHVCLSNYRNTDVEFYRQIVSETLSLCEDEIIGAYVSGTFTLNEIDKAIDFINKKKCTGKVLIEIQEKESVKQN